MRNCTGNKTHSGTKLLIIDDDIATRILIKDILEDTGIPVLESGCGQQAFNLFMNYQKEIGLILLDIWLPDCEGWFLAGLIRQLNQQIPVIAVSAILPDELASRYRSAGCTGYISKPFDAVCLKEIVISHIHL